MPLPTTTAETKVRVGLLVVGLGALAFGAFSLLSHSFGDIVSAAVWFTVPAVLSDAVVLPVVAGVGWVLTRGLAPWLRLPVQVALGLVGVLTALAVPFIGRFGARADNPTLLDRDYLLGWAIYAGVIVAAAALWAGWRRARPHRAQRF